MDVVAAAEGDRVAPGVGFVALAVGNELVVGEPLGTGLELIIGAFDAKALYPLRAVAVKDVMEHVEIQLVSAFASSLSTVSEYRILTEIHCEMYEH